MNPGLAAVARALAYRAIKDGEAPGRGQAALRERILGNTKVLDVVPPRVEEAYARLMAISIKDMPPSTDDVSLLLDALAMRIGATNRADAWRAVGINPNRGRDLLARNAEAVDWPIWWIMRSTALEG